MVNILAKSVIYLILCFGYMTGTDWVSYELFYEYGAENAHFAAREPGFSILIYLANYITSDFWIFNGLCKVFYLWSLAKMISSFTNRVWSVIAFTLVFSTMFMLINCPMRFMIACSFLFLGVYFTMNKRWIFAIINILLALSFHLTVIIPVILFITGLFAKKFYSLKKGILVLITFIFLVLSTISGIYHFLFSHILSMIGLADFINSSYSYFNADSVLSLGALRNIILALFIIYYKDCFRYFKYGNLIFFYAVTYFWIDILFRSIPTAYRLSIFNGVFACIGISLLLFKHLKYNVRISQIYKYGVISLFIVLLLKTSYGSYVYYPYTNSIPYIILGHKSYSERAIYNKIEYSQTFGSKIGGKDNEPKGQKID